MPQLATKCQRQSCLHIHARIVRSKTKPAHLDLVSALIKYIKHWNIYTHSTHKQIRDQKPQPMSEPCLSKLTVSCLNLTWTFEAVTINKPAARRSPVWTAWIEWPAANLRPATWEARSAQRQLDRWLHVRSGLTARGWLGLVVGGLHRLAPPNYGPIDNLSTLLLLFSLIKNTAIIIRVYMYLRNHS